jgi:hypothetical protein
MFFAVTAHLFSSYVDNVVFASEAKQSRSTSFIDEILRLRLAMAGFTRKNPSSYF